VDAADVEEVLHAERLQFVIPQPLLGQVLGRTLDQ